MAAGWPPFWEPQSVGQTAESATADLDQSPTHSRVVTRCDGLTNLARGTRSLSNLTAVTRRSIGKMPRAASLDYVADRPRTVSLEDAIVCWLDLLGLRERLITSSQNASESAFVADYLRVLRPIYRTLRWDFSATDFRWNAFSDMIVLSVPIDSGHPEEMIAQLAIVAADVQFRLACLGWFLRGSVGTTVHDPSVRHRDRLD